MGLREMMGLIGTTVMVKVDGFTVPMTVNDAKTAYGNKRFLVSPVGGSGESWVDSSRINAGSTDSDVVATAPAPAPAAVKPTKTTEIEADSEAGRIRAWARGRGIHVNERGRIPAQVTNQYRVETGESGIVFDEAIAS